MNRWKRLLLRKRVLLPLLMILLIYGNNSSLLAVRHQEHPMLLAHRGLAQTFTMEGITSDTCTAQRIYPPEHPYLENTIPSMEAAFQAGADMVELDVKPTKDGQFAVFHDWTLGCRTNAEGMAKDYTMAELKTLDVGYGYTPDNGKTYPFRGQGVGLMPSLDEVLEHFPGRAFLLHIKSNDAEEGRMMARFLERLPEAERSKLAVYGGDEPIASLQDALPGVRSMSKATMKSCLIPYMAVGWTGYVPSACQGTELHLPEKIASYLWGWPNRFLNRMDGADTTVIVVGGDGSDFSSGFDTPEDVERLPTGYSGGIWTNRIDRIAPLFPKR
ncbi:glycerophosphodiester phosphodiesterase family protein [Gorillibacterium sp. sgz5001074]|uniref:glycerophosphodiester phosphodiesterase family protein n=1 Tax=Gorillibacterium sp. sgz5001074 TaxID=3446695 RepID=UPI003F667E6D